MRSAVACGRCGAHAVEWLRYSGEHLCRAHFLEFVERRVKREFRSQVDLRGGERIAIGMSGGKDSSTTAALLARFLENRRDVELLGVTIDEGIASYRPQGIEYARRLCARLGIEHRVLAYAETVGHGMDDVVDVDPEAIPCSYCRPFRRAAFNHAARAVDATSAPTALNLDDTPPSTRMNDALGATQQRARTGPPARRHPGPAP